MTLLRELQFDATDEISKQYGFDVDRIVELHVNGKIFATGAPFLQAQLFFRILSEVVAVSGLFIIGNDLISKHEDSGFYLSASTLNDSI